MATTIDDILTNELVINMLDDSGEPGKISIPLDGAASDADIIAIVDGFAALTNGLIEPKIVRSYPFLGYAVAGKPAAALQSLIAAVFAIDLQKVSPINATKTLHKQVLIPAYLDALRNDAVTPHSPVTGNSTLNALIALLEDNVNYFGPDGVYYPGGWTYSIGSSKFGTKLSVTDGL